MTKFLTHQRCESPVSYGGFSVLSLEVRDSDFYEAKSETWWNGTRAKYTNEEVTEIEADEVWYTGAYDAVVNTTSSRIVITTLLLIGLMLETPCV